MWQLTTLFYIIGGTLTTAASLFMFGSYLSTGKRVTAYLALAFLFVGLHAYAFALPVVIAPGNLILLEQGYIVGIAFIFLVLLTGLEVLRYMVRGISEDFTNLTGLLLSTLAAVAISVMLTNPETPIIKESGVILWNQDLLARWIIGLTSFFYGMVWGIIFYQNSLLVEDGLARSKLYVISADGFLLGTIALLVHTSSNEIQTIAGHILVISGSMITLAIYVMPRRFFSVHI